MRRDVLTTGQVGRICEFSSTVAKRMFASGELKGFIVPGGQDRRFTRASVVAYLETRPDRAACLARLAAEERRGAYRKGRGKAMAGVAS